MSFSSATICRWMTYCYAFSNECPHRVNRALRARPIVLLLPFPAYVGSFFGIIKRAKEKREFRLPDVPVVWIGIGRLGREEG